MDSAKACMGSVNNTAASAPVLQATESVEAPTVINFNSNSSNRTYTEPAPFFDDAAKTLAMSMTVSKRGADLADGAGPCSLQYLNMSLQHRASKSRAGGVLFGGAWGG